MRNEDVKPDSTAKTPHVEVHCKRTGMKLPQAEHESCPYCFGREGEVASGKHERFCDFVPGRDPVHFGFPPDTARDREG